jgi:hypothetical protein
LLSAFVFGASAVSLSRQLPGFGGRRQHVKIERGLLSMPNSRAGAEHFIDMLSGTVRLQCLIGLRQPPDPQEIDEIVQGAVAQFLYGCLVHKQTPPQH